MLGFSLLNSGLLECRGVEVVGARGHGGRGGQSGHRWGCFLAEPCAAHSPWNPITSTT